MKQTVLEDIIDYVKPKKKRLVTKKRVVMALNIASRLLGLAVAKQPMLAPLTGILEQLLQPSSKEDDPDEARRVLARIKNLKTKMSKASDIEQRTLRAQIDALYGRLTEVEV